MCWILERVEFKFVGRRGRRGRKVKRGSKQAASIVCDSAGKVVSQRDAGGKRGVGDG